MRPNAGAGNHALNCAIICGVIAIMFWRVMFLGETLVDVATLDNQLPWGYQADQAGADYPYNRRDLTDTYITRDYFVVNAYRDGELPLWNPYNLSGHPIHADGVTRIFSPALLLYLFLDVPLGYSVGRILELLIGALLMYLFLVCIGASGRGAVVGSLAFVLSAHAMLHLTGAGWWGGLMWLPAVLLFVDRAIVRMSYTAAVLAGFCLGAQFYCGYMPNQIYYVGTTILYYLFAAAGGSLGGRDRLRLLALGSVTLLVALALSAAHWMPIMELLQHSNRRIVPTDIGYIHLPPWYLLTFLFPTVFGAAYDAGIVSLLTAIGVSHDHILYISVGALLPVTIAFVTAWRMRGSIRGASSESRRLVFFAGLAVFAFLIVSAAPLYVHVTKFVPVLQTIRVIVRAAVLLMFSLSVLAAFGVDLLLKSSRDEWRVMARRLRLILTAGAAFIAVAFLISQTLSLVGLRQAPEGRGVAVFARRVIGKLSEQFLIPGPDLLLPLVFLFALALLVRMVAGGRIGLSRFHALFLALIICDLAWIGLQFNPTFERSRVFPATWTTGLLASLEPGRVLPAPADLDTNRRVGQDPTREKIIAPPNTLLPYEIKSVTGKDQLFPKWYAEYAALVEPQPNLSHVVFDKMSSPYLDLVNVRYVVTHSSTAAPEGYRKIAAGEGIAVHENPRARPRAYFAERVIVACDAGSALEALRGLEFDDAVAVVFGEAAAGTGEARIVEDRRNRVVIETRSETGGLVVLSDTLYPGWKATIDGSPAAILRVNHAFRGVEVPGGEHVLTFEFDPASLRNGARISLFGALISGIALAAAAARRLFVAGSRSTGHAL